MRKLREKLNESCGKTGDRFPTRTCEIFKQNLIRSYEKCGNFNQIDENPVVPNEILVRFYIILNNDNKSGGF